MTKILAIDDNHDNLVVLQALLKTSFPDVQYYAALSGREGIDMAAGDPPDLIFLDLVMPGMDGFETCRRIKENPLLQRIPVIILTAERTNAPSRIKALETGSTPVR